MNTFSQFQSLAYSASVSLLVTKQYYTRASNLEFFSSYGSNILAPALAGYLYKVIGLLGIWLAKVPPNVQGLVFAAQSLALQLVIKSLRA